MKRTNKTKLLNFYIVIDEIIVINRNNCTLIKHENSEIEAAQTFMPPTSPPPSPSPKNTQHQHHHQHSIRPFILPHGGQFLDVSDFNIVQK